MQKAKREFEAANKIAAAYVEKLDAAAKEAAIQGNIDEAKESKDQKKAMET